MVEHIDTSPEAVERLAAENLEIGSVLVEIFQTLAAMATAEQRMRVAGSDEEIVGFNELVSATLRTLLSERDEKDKRIAALEEALTDLNKYTDELCDAISDEAQKDGERKKPLFNTNNVRCALLLARATLAQGGE